MSRVLAWCLRAVVACATVMALVLATMPSVLESAARAALDTEEGADADGESDAAGEEPEPEADGRAHDEAGFARPIEAPPPRAGATHDRHVAVAGVRVVARRVDPPRPQDEFTRALHRPPAV